MFREFVIVWFFVSVSAARYSTSTYGQCHKTRPCTLDCSSQNLNQFNCTHKDDAVTILNLQNNLFTDKLNMTAIVSCFRNIQFINLMQNPPGLVLQCPSASVSVVFDCNGQPQKCKLPRQVCCCRSPYTKPDTSCAR